MGSRCEAAGGLLLLIGMAAGCSREYTLDPLTLTADALEVTAALREDPIFPLETPPDVRVATRAELADALYVEVLSTVERLGVSGSRSEELARDQAQELSRWVGAKYFHDRDAILVVPENVALIAAELNPEEDVTRDLLRGMLLLECAQALGVQRYGADQISAESRDIDQSITRRAVVEGFARFIARRAAARQPSVLESSFELTSRMIVGRPPAVIQSAEDAAEDQAHRQLAFIHEQGEQFVTEIFEAGGEPAIRKLFEDPPDDPDLIGRPAWYLNPASRPLPTVDLERALTAFEERFEVDQWERQRIDDNLQRIEAQLAFASSGDADRMVRNIVAAQSEVVTSRKDPERDNVSLQIKEHTSAAEAEFFVLQVRQIIESNPSSGVREIADPDERWQGVQFEGVAPGAGGPKMLGCIVEFGVLTISVTFTGELAVDGSLLEVLRVVTTAL